jgi:hypothetical protein
MIDAEKNMRIPADLIPLPFLLAEKGGCFLLPLAGRRGDG